MGVAAACHRGGGGGISDDCRLVADDPTHAMVKLAHQHEGNPAAAAEIIEHCLAPTGDECERMQKILPALPGMMPGTFQLPDAARVGELCQGMPPEMRRCMFPSYTLRHADECAKVTSAIPEPPPSKCHVPDVTIAIGADGVSVGSAQKEGALDKDWLEATLKPHVGGDCVPAVVVTAASGIRYQDIITAMEVSAKVGLPNVGLTGAGSGTHHALPGIPNAQKAPLVVISTTEVKLGDTSFGAPDQPATFAALAKALPPTTDGVVILQADPSTDASVINRLVDTLSAHGFDNLLFAVKKR
jgi:biopolymer transport protein ExbD